MLVAIDGPMGAGKSTVAKAVAERLGFVYLDTGAMYRCVALAGVRRGTGSEAVRPVSEMRIRFDGPRVLLDDEDVSEAIRTPEVSAAASRVATDPDVREALVAQQRRLTAEGDWVAEGRDVGTVVRPDAELKVFLSADDEVRARRRAAETGRPVERELADLRERDERDRTRSHSPLEPAKDAVEVDTTAMTLEAVVTHIAELATARADQGAILGDTDSSSST